MNFRKKADITHISDSGILNEAGKELSNSFLAPIDWARLNYGGPETNTRIESVNKKFKVDSRYQKSWNVYIARHIADLVENQSRFAYIFEYANRLRPNRVEYLTNQPKSPFEKLFKPPNLSIRRQKCRSGQSDNVRADSILPDSASTKKVLESKFIFFPHQSIFYAGMYVKDWPFRAVPAEDVGIIEWDYVAPETAEYYEELGVKWTTWEYLVRRFGGGKQAKAHATLNALTRNALSWSRALFEARYLYGCDTAKRILLNFVHARCAFIGYDILFPPALSQGLRECEIPTVAVQERTIQAFARNYNIMIDHYIVPDEQCKEAWEGKPFSDIRHMYIGGHWRLESEAKPVPDWKDFILVVDYHAELVSRWNTLTNWDNYCRFYEDLLELANRCLGFQFVVRTKEFMLDRVNPELLARLRECGNIKWDLSRVLNRSYRLLRSCRIIFGRHTSLMDEALALGIPAVVHENFCHSLPYLENVSAEYAANFDISSSVNEAEKLVRMRMSERSRPVNPESQIKATLQEILKDCPPRL